MAFSPGVQRLGALRQRALGKAPKFNSESGRKAILSQIQPGETISQHMAKVSAKKYLKKGRI